MYRPPTADYDFLLRHVVDGSAVLKTVAAGEIELDDARDLLAAAAALAMDKCHPLNAVGDRCGNQLKNGQVVTPPGTREAYQALADGGWMGIATPKSAGGEGLPWIVATGLSEIWSAADVALSLSMGLTMGATTAIAAAGDDDIRRTYLPHLVSGRWTATMNLTEPQAGTDLSKIRTTATLGDDGMWRMRGQKIFITWGDHDLTENIVHLVLARTPNAPSGLNGLSLFIVPKFVTTADGSLGPRNAVQVVGLEHKLGLHGSPTCTLAFDDATAVLLGGVNAGLLAMFVMMNVARVGTGVQALGVSDRAYQQARDYAIERIQGRVLDRPENTPIAEHPDVERLLMSMASAVSAMRAVSVQVCQWLDLAATDPKANQMADFFVPVLKGWLSETALKVTSEAIQVHGGAGYIEETGVAQHFRDARIMAIYEGTTAIQAKDLVGRKVLRDNGSTAEAALAEVEATVEVLRSLDRPVAGRCAQRLARAAGNVRTATLELLRFAAEGARRDAYAGSVAYLNSWGLLAGGWMHARALIAAINSDDEHASRRIAEADFYGAHHLSQITWLTETIEAGEIR